MLVAVRAASPTKLDNMAGVERISLRKGRVASGRRVPIERHWTL